MPEILKEFLKSLDISTRHSISEWLEMYSDEEIVDAMIEALHLD